MTVLDHVVQKFFRTDFQDEFGKAWRFQKDLEGYTHRLCKPDFKVGGLINLAREISRQCNV